MNGLRGALERLDTPKNAPFEAIWGAEGDGLVKHESSILLSYRIRNDNPTFIMPLGILEPVLHRFQSCSKLRSEFFSIRLNMNIRHIAATISLARNRKE